MAKKLEVYRGVLPGSNWEREVGDNYKKYIQPGFGVPGWFWYDHRDLKKVEMLIPLMM